MQFGSFYSVICARRTVRYGRTSRSLRCESTRSPTARASSGSGSDQLKVLLAPLPIMTRELACCVVNRSARRTRAADQVGLPPLRRHRLGENQQNQRSTHPTRFFQYLADPDVCCSARRRSWPAMTRFCRPPPSTASWESKASDCSRPELASEPKARVMQARWFGRRTGTSFTRTWTRTCW